MEKEWFAVKRTRSSTHYQFYAPDLRNREIIEAIAPNGGNFEVIVLIEKSAYDELARRLADMEAWTEPKPQIEYGLRHMQARIEKLEAEIERLKGEK